MISRDKTAEIDVVTIGESMVLFQPMTEGPLKYAPLFTKSIAGAESNVAIGLSRLGNKVRWISRLGTDPFGDLIMSTLAGEGVDVNHVIRDEEYPTAVYFKELKTYGDPQVYYYRHGSAASHLSARDIKSEWFSGCRHLHVTGITPALGRDTLDLIRESMQMASALGLSVSFDPNLRRKLWSEERARETLLSLVSLCDIFLPGIEEANFLVGPKSHEQYGKIFLDMGATVVALKLGPEGSIGFFEDSSIYAPPHLIEQVIDTVGAGDSFCVGLLSVLLNHPNPLSSETLTEALSSALVRGNMMGAMATQVRGDWEGLPKVSDIRQDMIKR